MTELRHTPEPWYVNGDTFDVERMEGTFIGSKRIVARCATGDDAMANACLIAAAPDLLAAAKLAVEDAVADDMDGWFRALKAAIAKAEGGAA